MSNKFRTLGIYADGMVLQRNTVNCIFGDGAEGDVSLSFKDTTVKSTAQSDGRWKIEFNPGEAGGPFAIRLENAGNTVIFNDVWVGEVWINSGQSNAQLPMDRLRYSYPYEMKLPKDNNIRMITIPITYSYDGPKDTIQDPKWICASPETIALMSGTPSSLERLLAKK